MAKKNKFKNIKLEQTELKPIAIGGFESRKRSSIGTGVLMTIFILTVVFLPEISDYINEYLKPIVVPVAPAVNPNIPNIPSQEEENENVLHEFTGDLVINNDDIAVSSFQVDSVNNTISYSITNNGPYQDIEQLNYYLEIYNKEQTLIERVKLANELTLSSGAFREVVKNIKAESALSIGYIMLIKKSVIEYPEVVLNTDTNGIANLVCKNAYSEVTYNFKDAELLSLTSIYTYTNIELDYAEKYNELKVKANDYNNKEGINSIVVGDTNEEKFNVITNVDLSKASRLYIFAADSFKYKTLPKVVKFEMETQGFTCE